MKTRLLINSVAVATLVAATANGWARPPLQHSVSGVIEAIDCASHTIILKPKAGASLLTFVWNDSTRFTKKGGCAKCSLDSGQAVRVSYRREVGQNVLREVSTKGASAACGVACR